MPLTDNPERTRVFLTRFYDVRVHVSTPGVTHTRPGSNLVIGVHMTYSSSRQVVEVVTSSVTLHPEVARRKKNAHHAPCTLEAVAQQIGHGVSLEFPPNGLPARSSLACGRLLVDSGPCLAPFVYSADPILPRITADPIERVSAFGSGREGASLSSPDGRQRDFLFQARVPDNMPESVSFLEDDNPDARVDVRLRIHAEVTLRLADRALSGRSRFVVIRIMAENVVKVLPQCSAPEFYSFSPRSSHEPIVEESNRSPTPRSMWTRVTRAQRIVSGSSPMARFRRADEDEAGSGSLALSSGSVSLLSEECAEEVSGRRDRRRFRGYRASAGVRTSSGVAFVLSGQEEDYPRSERALEGLDPSRVVAAANALSWLPLSSFASLMSTSSRNFWEMERGPADGRRSEKVSSFLMRKNRRLLPSAPELMFTRLSKVTPNARLERILVETGTSDAPRVGDRITVVVHASCTGCHLESVRRRSSYFGRLESGRRAAETVTGTENDYEQVGLQVRVEVVQCVAYSSKRIRCSRRCSDDGRVSLSPTGVVLPATMTLEPTRSAGFYPSTRAGALSVEHFLCVTARCERCDSSTISLRGRIPHGSPAVSAMSPMLLRPSGSGDTAYGAMNARSAPRWASAGVRRVQRAQSSSIESFARRAEDCSQTCAVCLDDEGPLYVLPGCGHAGHSACLDEWLLRRAVCPLCLAPVDVPQEDSTAGADCCENHSLSRTELRRVYC